MVYLLRNILFCISILFHLTLVYFKNWQKSMIKWLPEFCFTILSAQSSQDKKCASYEEIIIRINNNKIYFHVRDSNWKLYMLWVQRARVLRIVYYVSVEVSDSMWESYVFYQDYFKGFWPVDTHLMNINLSKYRLNKNDLCNNSNHHFISWYWNISIFSHIDLSLVIN